MITDFAPIRPATAADLPAVAALYDKIHAEERAGRTTTGWLAGIYPVRATAESALARGDLFVYDDGAVRASYILNQVQVDVYTGAPWTLDVPDAQVMVLHTLVVDPAASGRGIGRTMVAYYEAYARAHGCTDLRMDTNARNAAARHLYAKLGYREIGVVPCEFNGIPGVQLVLLEKSAAE